MNIVKNKKLKSTIIEKIAGLGENHLYIKRDDLIPFSFGGNKARKALYFFDAILSGKYDTVVTYGSSSSNHCRVVANACAKYHLKCMIISPEEDYCETFNSQLVKRFGARVIKTPLDKVSTTIDALMEELSHHSKAYFIPGGGHGNLGTQAYVDAYDEIRTFEEKEKIYFDYIFLASGTGTTQAGLVCGAALNGDVNRKIVGISVARNNPRGKQVIKQSVMEYLESCKCCDDVPDIIFEDSYTCGGYGKYNEDIQLIVNNLITSEGIPMNRTYTGKAFYGMREYLKKQRIQNKNILFMHTGGSPLFFDDLGEQK